MPDTFSVLLLHKDYKSHIIISESTKEQLTGAVEGRDLGEAQVRGKEKPSMRIIRKQTGYMIEIPIGIAVVVVLLWMLLPKLPLEAAKALAIVGALIVTAGAFYMLIVPGWQPDPSGRLRWPWNWIAFVLISLVLMGAAGTFAILG